jgi:23S rRNA (uracil1939-C5)-methyltransferase
MEIEETAGGARFGEVVGRAVVRVERLDARGEAVGHVERWLIIPTAEQWVDAHGPHALDTLPPETCAFVGGLPGELVEVEARWPLPRRERHRARRVLAPQVRLRAVLEPSSDRVPAGCLVFGDCGGCQLQYLAYGRQLAWKTARMADLLSEAGFAAAPILPAIGSDDPWGYRNHMRFSVDRAGRAGLTARGSHRVIPLRACPIAHPLINAALDTLNGVPLPRPQVLIRCAVSTGQLLMQPAPDSALRARLAAAGLDVQDDALTEELAVPCGEPAPGADHADGAPEGAARVSFRMRPSSFFQTNTAQANRMAELVLAGLPAGRDATLVDTYCGVGTFAALMAARAGRVLAIEESASAVRDARWNLRSFANVEVIQAKVEAALPALGDQLDGLVIDPPRAGCGRSVLEALVARQVPRVVYVSCEPTTLARDLAYLCRETGVYRLARVQPLDMFPQTAHIETIVWLEVA